VKALLTEFDAADPIDAIITWVDGNAPDHRATRARFMAQSGGPLGENARNPHRWEQSDEIYFCLRSIHHHAPWVRYIWLLVEGAGPDLDCLPEALRAKVRIARHSEVFGEYAAVLPTFNSLAIESMMWRIEGLSERFLYFNDDVFLTAPLAPQDMFEGESPVLRGAWRDYAALADDSAARDDPALFNHFMQINAARLADVAPGRVFAAAHVVHPMRRSVMQTLFETHRAAFEANISHRFRDLSQFLPQGLHNHHCIGAGLAMLRQQTEHLHIKSGQGAGNAPALTRGLLLAEAMAGVRFLCVNDLPQLEALVPDARALIDRVTGGRAG